MIWCKLCESMIKPVYFDTLGWFDVNSVKVQFICIKLYFAIHENILSQLWNCTANIMFGHTRMI